jgi:Ca2+-binding EF-hand superfamily protein
MGNKETKPKKKSSNAGPNIKHTGEPIRPEPTTNKPLQLSESDYTFLINQSGLSRLDIKELFDKFMAGNPDGELDRKEFSKLYCSLRYESPELLDEITEFIFKAFDANKSGTISFSEFLIGYSLTSKGDLKRKLEYAFELYDSDGNGYLDQKEIKEVITGMLDLLGAEKRSNNASQLAEECLKQLDASNDGKVSKDEFINGLLKNYSLRSLMSPFQ